MIKRNQIISLNIVLPWWLKWAKKFIHLEFKKHIMPENLRGKHIDMLLFDEISYIDIEKLKKVMKK